MKQSPVQKNGPVETGFAARPPPDLNQSLRGSFRRSNLPYKRLARWRRALQPAPSGS